MRSICPWNSCFLYRSLGFLVWKGWCFHLVQRKCVEWKLTHSADSEQRQCDLGQTWENVFATKFWLSKLYENQPRDELVWSDSCLTPVQRNINWHIECPNLFASSMCVCLTVSSPQSLYLRTRMSPPFTFSLLVYWEAKRSHFLCWSVVRSVQASAVKPVDQDHSPTPQWSSPPSFPPPCWMLLWDWDHRQLYHSQLAGIKFIWGHRLPKWAFSWAINPRLIFPPLTSLSFALCLQSPQLNVLYRKKTLW